MTKPILNPKLKIQNGASRLGIGFLFLLGGCGPALNAEPKTAPAAALEVVLAGKPARKDLPLYITEPARIEAIEQTPIHSKLAGYVAEVAVDYGDVVKKDQRLLTLSVPELDAELMQKQALLEQAHSELRQAEAAAKASEAVVATARSKVAQAEAAQARAEADVERWRSEAARISQLAAGGSVTTQLVEETHQKKRIAEASFAETRAAIEAAQAGVAESQAQAAKAAADVDAAKARVRVAEANVTQVESLRSYLTIKSPFFGVVTSRRVDTGHFVLPASGGDAPLLVVARTDKIRAIVAVTEGDAGYVDQGDPVILSIPALRGADIPGKITRTTFAVGASNRSLETIIDLDNADGRLRPGLYATAKITLVERKDALTLPSAAVIRQGKEAFCYKLLAGKAIKTPIQVGIKVADDIEITSGLTDADIIILNKASSLKDGQPVEVLPPAQKK
jgi:RND family efflux transporter MFP subunit